MPANQDKQRLQAEQARQLYEQGPIGFAATLINACILTFILWRVVLHSKLVAWLAAIVLITLLRWLLLCAYRRSSWFSPEVRRWNTMAIAGIAVSGIIWGSAGMFLFPVASAAHQVFLAFVLGGMVAGAAGTYSVMMRAFLVYSLPALAPITIKFLAVGNQIGLAMGGMVLLFGFLMFLTAKRVNSGTITVFRLNTSLAEAKERAERFNEELKSEILEREKAEVELRRHRDQLEAMVEERTAEIVRANEHLQQEIEERKLVEEALRDSEEKYRVVVENTNDAIIVTQNGMLRYANQATSTISGYSLDELTSRPFVDFIHPEDQEMVMTYHSKTLNGEEVPQRYVFRLSHKNKEIRWCEARGELIAWEDKPATLNLLRDISEWRKAKEEKKKLEAQLHHSQKMEAIATLAGGIAHEFNNALFGITGNLELLEMDLSDELNAVSNYLGPMRDSARRMASLTDQLLAYARGGKYQPKTISLSQLVKNTLPLVRRHIDASIQFELDLPDSISNVKADLAQMQMVLSGVVANAAEAIEGEGHVRIVGRNEHVIEKYAAHRTGADSGPYVCLSIEDDGKGMDPKTRERLFEPFFSTKLQGRGLGMAAAYGIIKNHGGWISVGSELDKGTVVRIYLPAVKIHKGEAPQTNLKLVKGTGTILLIEDEEYVANVGRAILERLGYGVLEAKTGMEAVELARKFDNDIALALLDIGLPDMGGERVYRLLMEARPGLKVVVCSGYAIDGPAQEILDAGALGFIQKPFSLVTLSATLNEALEANR